MHVIVLVIMVFFTHTAGDNKSPITQVMRAPAGTTLDDCKVYGKTLTDTVKGREGVADVEFGCVDLVVKASI